MTFKEGHGHRDSHYGHHDRLDHNYNYHRDEGQVILILHLLDKLDNLRQCL